ncbi:hypothetical protein CTEN210_18175 [Chaetoceros tenuissimus]|uniref:SGNH hydrolase-type esterase domain-containing protein n=1 Tax=Chaetoceros tenuissimus TaxID=426638 RepID=A0AAD3HFX2_9STRA|nr:hypothetical protein CTEN210_18175 [Chaetoceros tenuissimus]
MPSPLNHEIAPLALDTTEPASSRRREKKKQRSLSHFIQRVQIWIMYNKRNQLLTVFILFIISQSIHRQYQILSTQKHAKNARVLLDYSNISSLQDLKDAYEELPGAHLCFPGMKKYCKCDYPLKAKDRQGRRHWLKASHMNKERIVDMSKHKIDVVFYGDSITEGWLGTSYGFHNGRKEGSLKIFKKYFDNEKRVGIAMGISGDTSVNLLWRMQNGELPDTLQSPIFWMLIGTNDLGNTWCSPDAVVLGILRNVLEIRKRHPGSAIVLNALLPRSFAKNGDPYKGKKVSSKKYLPELYSAILDINRSLKEYAENHDNVEYFDANHLFFQNGVENDIGIEHSGKKKKAVINQELMYDFLHPSPKGYDLLGHDIAEKVNALLK